jgi:probable blue pigment (indigoidine) exporter
MVVYRKLPTGVWWWRAAVLGLLNFGLFFTLLFLAAYRLPGGVASTLGAVQPLLSALFAWLLMRERPRRLAMLVALAGAVGVGMVVLGPSARLDGVGLLAGFGSSTCMALATVLIRYWGRPVALPLFTAWQLTAGGLLLVPLTLIIEGPAPNLSGTNLLGTAYLTIIGTAVAYMLWFRGVERLGTTASFLLLLSPVMALALGALLLHQSLSPVQMVGVLLVLGSIYLGQRTGANPGAQRPLENRSLPTGNN